MKRLFLIFIPLCLWGNFLFRSMDIWHSTGHFVQVGILIIFCSSLFFQPRNEALGAFLLWTGLVTSYWWIKAFSLTNHYPVKTFMPFFNLLCLVLFYKLIVEYLDGESIEKILKWLKYSVIALLVYCVLQYLHLDEFFNSIAGKQDELVGTMGNTMHLAGLLALLQPLFFSKNREDILALCLLWLIILLTGSATGLVGGLAVILFWLFFRNRIMFIIFFVLSLSSCIALYVMKSNFFCNSSRFEIWQNAYELAKNHCITGLGLGSWGASNINRGSTHWQHLHNDYFQIIFELGIIGLILVIWCIKDCFKNIEGDLKLRLASIFFGFCLLSSVTFFAHLWIPATLAMFAYGSIYCLRNKENLC